MNDLNDRLDTAVRSTLGDLVATTPERADTPLDAMPVSTFAEDRSRRVPVMVGSLALAAAATLALVAVVARNQDTQGSSDAPAVTIAPGDTISNSTTTTILPTDSTILSGTTQLVRLAPGLVPWYEASDAITAGFAPFEPGPAQDNIRCTDWTYVDSIVTCRALANEGYLPAVTYSAEGDYVDIATLHADIDAATYANNYSHGKDVGYDQPLLPLQDISVNGLPGKLVEVSNGIRRVTWSPTAGTLIAIETGPGLTREDLLAIAAGVVPTTATPNVLLVLATSAPDVDGFSVQALGSVVDGELCIPTNRGCTSAAPGSLVVEHSISGKAGIVGLAGAGIVSLRITMADGVTPVTFPGGTAGDPLTDLVVGTSRAFAIDLNGQYDVKIVGLDANGNPVGAGAEIQATVTTMVTPTTSLLVDSGGNPTIVQTTAPHA